MDYLDFLERKRHIENNHGFDPVFMPSLLFDFQKHLVEWACRKGRAAVFADCGLGKTFIQLAWAENVALKTQGRVLILTPLAVAFQTVREGEKIGVEVTHRRTGIENNDRIVVTNYERLHYFNPADFDGIVCDESSILKNYAGKLRDEITRFMYCIQYRLLCTATAAPNDYMELGTSSEALGIMKRTEMLATYFVHDGGDTAKWRIKGHAQDVFWRWMSSWARAVRFPSDIGFDNAGFVLPPMVAREHVVNPTTQNQSWLFEMPAITLDEQREELRRTIIERCEMVASLINDTGRPAVAWCQLNQEGDTITRMVPDAIQVSGSDDDERKEDVFRDFAAGNIRVLVTKPRIAGFGLNWQHCAHQTFFPSHSYEQYYQAVRRCWRFGQKQKVTIDIVTTEGQQNIIKNMQRKSEQADVMFSRIVAAMHIGHDRSTKSHRTYEPIKDVPSWIK